MHFLSIKGVYFFQNTNVLNFELFFRLFLFDVGKVAFLAVSEKFRRLATIYPCLCQLFAEIMEKRTPYLWNITSLLSMTFQRRDCKSEPPQSSSISHLYEIGVFLLFAELRCGSAAEKRQELLLLLKTISYLVSKICCITYPIRLKVANNI